MVLDKLAPLKSQKIKGDYAPFLFQRYWVKRLWTDLKLDIGTQSGHLIKNILAFQKQNNFSNNLRKKTKRNYFIKSCFKESNTEWRFLEYSQTVSRSIAFLHNDDIAIGFENITITDDKELSKIFNEFYNNVVQNITGTAPVKIN